MSNFEKQLFPESPALTPYVVIERFEAAQKVYGTEVVMSDQRFKKAREMYTTAIFLLGYSTIARKEYWLMPCYEEVPDVFVDRSQPHPEIANGEQTVRLCIEVTDWEAHSEETLSERIINKLSGKKYPPYYVLLVHAKKNIAADLEKEYNEIEKLDLPVMEIWVTAQLANAGDYMQTVFSMKNQRLGVDFSARTLALENKKQMPGALKTQLRKKGTGIEIYPDQYEFRFPPLE